VIVLDPSASVDPFEQIRRQIADGIRSGELVGGQRLPSIRQLAGDLQVAAGTVAKAYAALTAEGLIETNRTRGTRVVADQALAPSLHRAARRYVSAAEGLDLEAALGAVRAAWAAAHGEVGPTDA